MSRVENILKGIVKSDRVAAAYLFLGPPGAEKKQTALEFADLLGCRKQDKFEVAPDGKSFKIDQIRELQQWVRYGPSASRYLAVIVEGADTLTDQAAAAFLKTLEEPAPGVVFMLLAEREDKLLPTITSRCQKIIFAENLNEAKLEANPFYKDLKNVSNKTPSELMQLSALLAKEKDRIEEVLYDLSFYARQELQNTQLARIILDTVRFIKRKANLKLALDVMCLRFAGQ